LLDAIEAARRRTPVVIVAIHSHEPSNHSDGPADFVRAFAAQAIERGASLVVGHGPHRLRGIEVRPGGVILHSLGNFLYPYEPLAARDADLFDSGVDLYGLALGAIGAQERRTPAPMDAPEWWQSVVAVASFSNGGLTSVRFYPIDLGTDRAAERRGLPQLAEGGRASAILTRLAALSTPFGTTLDIANGVATLHVEPGRAP
jgi:poly-gamma-glutamate synthesis protein (capsule biosynthesis protein)